MAPTSQTRLHTVSRDSSLCDVDLLFSSHYEHHQVVENKRRRETGVDKPHGEQEEESIYKKTKENEEEN